MSIAIILVVLGLLVALVWIALCGCLLAIDDEDEEP